MLGFIELPSDQSGKEKDRNTSGQRLKNFNTSFIDRSFVVAENNRVVKQRNVKQFFKSVDCTHIFYCCNKQWRHWKRHR